MLSYWKRGPAEVLSVGPLFFEPNFPIFFMQGTAWQENFS